MTMRAALIVGCTALLMSGALMACAGTGESTTKGEDAQSTSSPVSPTQDGTATAADAKGTAAPAAADPRKPAIPTTADRDARGTVSAKPNPTSASPAPTGGLAGPHPTPLLKTHFNKGMGKHVFKDRTWDLEQIKKAFNGVIVTFEDAKLIEDIRAAGLVAMVEFDEKDDFKKGKSIKPTVEAIIRLVKSHPGMISGIRVADRLNQKLIPEEALAYLRETGGVFHREIPGVPVIVDVEDWELTCGLAGQSSCTAHAEDDYRYCNNKVLTDFYKSGLVDGFEVAMNLKKDDPEVMVQAAQRARALFPKPFLLYSRTASLSFAEDHYPGDAALARMKVAAYIEAPIRGGMDGIDLWAWHRPWKDELRTFMDKSATTNPLWNEMVKAYSALPASKSVGIGGGGRPVDGK